MRVGGVRMTGAERDYPTLVQLAAGGSEEAADALEEIRNLRRWKLEATQVLKEWDSVWDALNRPGVLGASKAEACEEVVRRLGSS